MRRSASGEPHALTLLTSSHPSLQGEYENLRRQLYSQAQLQKAWLKREKVNTHTQIIAVCDVCLLV